MAVKNTCYGGTDWNNGETMEATDLSDTFAATYNCMDCCYDNAISTVNSCFSLLDSRTKSNIENILENAINIACLQYTTSVSDIEHDYLVVDVFTDVNGYNNSVCTSDSDSTYDATGDYYFNGSIHAACQTMTNYYCCYVITGAAGPTFCECESGACFYTLADVVQDDCDRSGCWTVCACLTNNQFCTDYEKICFCIYDCMCLLSFIADCGGFRELCNVFCVGGAEISNCCCLDDTDGDCCPVKTFCLAWCKSSGTDFDFYCNGSCVCQVDLSGGFDVDIVHRHCVCAPSTEREFTGAVTCIKGACQWDVDCTKIVSVPICFDSPIDSIYVTASGDVGGSLYYNLIETSGSSCVACNKSLGCPYTLSTCCCCVALELWQCANGPSCIKSYALTVTEA